MDEIRTILSENLTLDDIPYYVSFCTFVPFARSFDSDKEKDDCNYLSDKGTILSVMYGRIARDRYLPPIHSLADLRAAVLYHERGLYWLKPYTDEQRETIKWFYEEIREKIIERDSRF
ncbi:MAG: hypothetical protein MPJ24_05040 [Pirellulaceae bacterium]|nr:hypothetical protein [Pirellulaceae bacterium]